MTGARSSLAKGNSGSSKGMIRQLLDGETPSKRRIPLLSPRPREPQMLAPEGFSTLETTTKRSFAPKRSQSGMLAIKKGEADEQVFRESGDGADRRPGACGADYRVPEFRLFGCRWGRRHDEGRPPMAARLLRHHLDRASLLFQLRADSDDAKRPGRAETGRHQIYCTERTILFSLGRGLHRPDRPAPGLVLR